MFIPSVCVSSSTLAKILKQSRCFSSAGTRFNHVFFFLTQFQTPVTLCSGELWSILVVRPAHSARADLRSRLCHVSSKGVLCTAKKKLFFGGTQHPLAQLNTVRVVFFLSLSLCQFPIRQGALHVRKGYPELVIPSSQGWGIGLQNRALTYPPFFSVSFSMIFLSPHFGQITIFRILAM